MVAGSGMISTSIALNAVSAHGTCSAVFTAVAAICTFLLASIRTLNKISWLAWIGTASILIASEYFCPSEWRTLTYSTHAHRGRRSGRSSSGSTTGRTMDTRLSAIQETAFPFCHCRDWISHICLRWYSGHVLRHRRDEGSKGFQEVACIRSNHFDSHLFGT